MIANISSAESSFEETLNTLKYANRAKNIKTNAQRNVLNVNYHISEYVQLITNLRGEIKMLKDQISSVPQPEHGQHFSADGFSFQDDNPMGDGTSSASPEVAKGKFHGKQQLSSAGNHGPSFAHSPGNPMRHANTPLEVLRESMRSAAHGQGHGGEGRELVNQMREKIVENFQERMQLRRSLIELEDQNVQNSIEVSKRQLIVVQWSDGRGNLTSPSSRAGIRGPDKADFSVDLMGNAPSDIKEAWGECEQLRKAILKNNAMKKNISRRLRHNEREAEKFR